MHVIHHNVPVTIEFNIKGDSLATTPDIWLTQYHWIKHFQNGATVEMCVVFMKQLVNII